MSSEPSTSFWLEQLKKGDQEAARVIWERVHKPLLRQARQQLGDSPRRDADEEDVVLSAFNSFCTRAKQGKFGQLEDSEDLWQLLLVITQRKAINRYKRATRYQKLVASESSAVGRSHSSAAGQLARRADSSPAPELVASFTDNCRHLLDLLGDDSLRSVALWKMEGYTNAEIAKKLDTATRTVERKLRSIRTIWTKEFPR